MNNLFVGNFISLKGYVTQKKYLLGHNMSQLESLLGFQKGRLLNGAYICEISKLPEVDEFILSGYSQVAEHRLNRESMIIGLDEKKLKSIARSTWQLYNNNTLVKILPLMLHDNALKDDEQYPPGWGIPQWKLSSYLAFQIVKKLDTYPYDVYC